ncbi:major tail protein [Vallitalea maricola]|uniref:Uncharacterized protein n=1 Tax=Vallitalea maricola TaxID=3074433 RepID=A0ACB5UEA7_9FIRM|nr:hypothetical protein AN2V17_04280 [Vallitalea sp. AN17-2]
MEGYMTGVENSHIAIKNGMTYETPEFASYSTDIKIAPQVATGALYGDNAARATQAKTTKYIVTATFTNLPLALKAKILGHQYSNGQMITKSTDKAPKMAYGFNFTKENGAKRYVWLYNGQWQENEENGQSESENINFQTVTLTGEFIVREDNTFKMTLDTDSPGYNPQKAANWYKAVQEFEEDTTEPTLVSSVPADAATGVAIDSTITLTFNKAMNLNTLNNILVVDELVNDVDTTIALSDDYKTVTITPKANLGANMLHNVILNKLMDTAGNTLPYTTIDFTTA